MGAATCGAKKKSAYLSRQLVVFTGRTPARRKATQVTAGFIGRESRSEATYFAEHTAMNAVTMTKAELVEEVTRVTELPRKESEIVVETIFESIIKALQTGEKIEIRGFGSFRTRERRGRTGRNPKTGEKVNVPAKRIPYFKPSKELKDFVNTSQSASASASGESS
jgi:integration host factor subunit beta